MHFLADSQSKSDDSNQFLDTKRDSNPLMVRWKWALQDGIRTYDAEEHMKDEHEDEPL